jgi:molybdate transport system regulatory protein
MKPDLRFHILAAEGGAALALGPGKMALLEAIAATGSISAAAKALGMSYRRAWILVDETNRCLARPAVATATGGDRGGGAVLTDFGAAFLAAYRAVERDAREGVDTRLAPFLAKVPPRARKRA